LPLSIGKAMKDKRVLDAELIRGYIRANANDAHRRAKTARFLAGQLDPDNNRWTLTAVDGLRRFDHPNLLLWGASDPHFGPSLGGALARRHPRPVALELLADTGHLLMEEQPEQVARHLRDFLAVATANNAAT
jgi:pimeloyl-ACP methyl ester carboxylesterase